jgi:hypothetical protein
VIGHHFESALKQSTRDYLINRLYEKIKLKAMTIQMHLKNRWKGQLKAEKFGGIEFVQISLLSSSQKKLFRLSPVSKKIISIIRGKELLPDCVLYKDYCDWYLQLEK